MRSGRQQRGVPWGAVVLPQAMKVYESPKGSHEPEGPEPSTGQSTSRSSAPVQPRLARVNGAITACSWLEVSARGVSCQREGESLPSCFSKCGIMHGVMHGAMHGAMHGVMHEQLDSARQWHL